MATSAGVMAQNCRPISKLDPRDMRRRYFVVDQNYLRTQALQAILIEQPDVQLVLPDLGMFEIAKPDQRELTVRQSLGTIARYPARVFVSRAMSECLKYELETCRSVEGHLLFREGTCFLRKVLLAVATGTPNDEYTRVIEDRGNHLSGLKRDYLNHETNKTRAVELVDATKREMSIEFAKRIRGARATQEELLAFIREKAPSILVGVLVDKGFSRERAVNVARKKSMLLRYFYAKLWACLVWEKQGRLDGLGAEKVSNDLLDSEYVLAATFVDGVLSMDTKVNEALAQNEMKAKPALPERVRSCQTLRL